MSLCSQLNLTKTCVVAHPSRYILITLLTSLCLPPLTSFSCFLIYGYLFSLTNDDASLIIKPMFFEMPSNDTFNALAPYLYISPLPSLLLLFSISSLLFSLHFLMKERYFNTTLQTRGIRAEFKMYPKFIYFSFSFSFFFIFYIFTFLHFFLF